MEKKLHINSLLCFISSAYKDYNVETLKELVCSFYTENDISEAKKVICNVLNNDSIDRRGPNKLKREIDDIFDVYKSMNNDNNVFVCDDYKKLPPSGLDSLVPHLTKISQGMIYLKDCVPQVNSQVETLCTDVAEMKTPVSKLNTIENMLGNDILQLKDDVLQLKDSIRSLTHKINGYEIRRLSSFSHSNIVSPSAPPLSQIVDDSVLNDIVPAVIDNTSLLDDLIVDIRYKENASESKSDLIAGEDRNCNKAPLDQNTQSHILCENGNDLRPKYSDIVRLSPEKKLTNVHKISSPHNKMKSPLATKTVRSKFDQRRYLNPERNTFVNSKLKTHGYTTGKRKLNNNLSLKSAERCIDVYIGRCSENMDSEILIKYLQEELKINPRNCVKLATKVPYSTAFKITINDSFKGLVLDPESWPEGIICRKFYGKRN